MKNDYALSQSNYSTYGEYFYSIYKTKIGYNEKDIIEACSRVGSDGSDRGKNIKLYLK